MYDYNRYLARVRTTALQLLGLGRQPGVRIRSTLVKFESHSHPRSSCFFTKSRTVPHLLENNRNVTPQIIRILSNALHISRYAAAIRESGDASADRCNSASGGAFVREVAVSVRWLVPQRARKYDLSAQWGNT